MPFYDYKCDNCNHIEYDVRQNINSDIIKCPICNHDMKRLIKGTSFVLKGGGWFKDGYTTKSNNKNGD
ncbi:MAG TPA: zinc ribbon domain-containing protein [Thermotogota bacterium]|nr:zinc ribbon domain-containing protein [Thermotogota bacterium]